jgi:SAM-dependent methyltransferase
MSDHLSNRAWLEEETARRYKMFVEKTTMYQELSQCLVDLVGIEPGMQVLDLGCGTGVSTGIVLARLENRGHVCAVDISGPMLAVAREQVTSSRVRFFEADAADIAELFHDEPLFDREVLTALRRVLAPDGLFVFNVPEPYFSFKNIPRSPKVSLLFKQLAAERYGVGPQDLRTMQVFLNQHDFELVTTKEFTRVRSSEESYLFFQLPVASAWMDPPLDYETRLALLDEARQLAEPDKTVQQRWIYFVVRSKRRRE